MNRRRGFTLVELGLVVLILALMSAVAAPRLAATLDSARVREYQSKVFALPTEARERAIETGSTITLAYTEGAFRIEQESADGETGDPTVLTTVGDIGDVQPGNFELNGDQVGEDEWSVRFFADGTAEPGAFALTDNGDAESMRILSTGKFARGSGTPEEILNPDEKWEAGDNGML